jgi:hypothetical protein
VSDPFDDDHGVGMFKDVVRSARGTAPDDIAELRAIYDTLPESIKHEAESWGFIDTVFRDLAWSHLRKVTKGWAHKAVTGRGPTKIPLQMQNIPIRTPEGKRVRDAFAKPELGVDWGDLEKKVLDLTEKYK